MNKRDYKRLDDRLTALKRLIDAGDATVIDLAEMVSVCVEMALKSSDVALETADAELLVLALKAARKGWHYSEKLRHRLEEAQKYDLACNRSWSD